MKIKLLKLKLPVILSVLLFMVSVSTLKAQAKAWLGTTTDWNTASNWNPAGVPGSANTLTIPALGGTVLFAPKLTANGQCSTISFSGSNSISNTTGAETLTIGATITTGAGFTTTISCPLILTVATTFNFSSATSNLTVSGVVSGGFGITKLGSGILTLAGLNTYSGTTTISTGTLRIGKSSSGSNSPLGTTAAGTTVASGGVLDLNGFSLSNAESLTLSGAGLSGNGTVNNSAASAATFSGPVILGANTSVGVSSGSIALNNLTGAFTLTKIGSGNLIFNAGISSINALIISGGNVTAGADLTFTSGLTVNSGVLDMTGFALIVNNTFVNGTGSGQIQTSNTTATPLSGGINWVPKVVYYNSAGGQTIVAGNYLGGIKLTNTTGIQKASGNITGVSLLEILNSGTLLNMAGFQMDGTALSIVSGATLEMSSGNLTFTDFTSMAGLVRFSGSNNGQAIPSGTVEYYGASQTVAFGYYNNLIINEALGNATIDPFNITTVNGTLALTNGTFNIGTDFTSNGGITSTVGKLGGNLTSNLTLGGASGNAESLYFASNASSIANLTLNHVLAVTTTLYTDLSVYGGIIFGSSNDILDLNAQHVTLKSDVNGTAYVGKVLGTLTGATNVTAERFIGTSKRSWRLLTIPVTGLTIRGAWAGGIAPNPAAPAGETAGNATLITGHQFTTGAAATAAGFDFFNGLGSGTTSSIRFYTPTAFWNSATNTPVPTNAPDKQGYMLYVRGDRTIADPVSFGTTTVRPTGTLKKGQQIVSVADAYTVIGNPYAASVNLDLIYNNGSGITANSNIINRNFYVWDATQGTSGAYISLSYDISGVYLTSSGTDGTPYLTVNSGQAFFVQQKGTGGNLTIEESNKTITTPPVLFRPVGTTGNGVSMLSVKLYQATGTTIAERMDATVARFNDLYNVSPNEVYDAAKLNNFNENLSLVRNNRYLSIESRPFPTKSDTLFVPFWNLNIRDYALTVTSSNLAGLNQTAILIDQFTNTQKVIDLGNATTSYPFTITSDAASSSLNRFLIVMAPSVPLAVNFTKINASVDGNKVKVNWYTGSEQGIKNYDVEKSTNGINFSKTGSVVASNASAGASYQWLDNKPNSGNNFYRIRSNDENGQYTYSDIAKVQVNGKKGIQVTPMFITNQRFTLFLNDVAAGSYDLLLTNTSGQQVYQKIIKNAGGYNSLQIDLGKVYIAAGIYNLSVSNARGVKENFRLVINN